jgi:hypothetical protein
LSPLQRWELPDIWFVCILIKPCSTRDALSHFLVPALVKYDASFRMLEWWRMTTAMHTIFHSFSFM